MPEILDRDGLRLQEGDIVDGAEGIRGEFEGWRVRTFGFVALMRPIGRRGEPDVYEVEPTAEENRYRCGLKFVRRSRRPSAADVPFAWSTTIRVERRGCPDAAREITVTGEDILAAPGEGKAFGATAIARAMHASSQKVAAAVKEMRADA